MSRTRSIALGALVAIVALAAGLLLARALLTPQESTLAGGTLLTPPRPLPDIALVDHDGRPFDRSRLHGHWSLLFFGFTNCPDVCPATLGVLAQVEKQLGDLPAEQRPQIVLVSVDPERDTPEQLAKYVKFFSASFVGVGGAPQAIAEFTRNLGAPVMKTPLPEGGYTVDHSAAIFAINPAGELRALFSPPHSPKALTADVRRLVRESR